MQNGIDRRKKESLREINMTKKTKIQMKITFSMSADFEHLEGKKIKENFSIEKS